MRDRGWMEYTVYPLFSPQSLIAEGTANYGIEVAFPRPERLAFERDVLFPLAGLDPGARRRTYYDVLDAGRSACRTRATKRRGSYLNGTIDRAAAVAWLEKYALYTTAARRAAA